MRILFPPFYHSYPFMSKITFNNKQSPFFRALKQKVDDYFVSNHAATSGNWQLYRKSIIQVAAFIILYVVLVFFTPVWPLALVLSSLFGLNLALIGFNIMHEGGHQSFSKHKWLNNVSAYSLNMMGGTTYFWKLKHNINHHTYTNIEGMDFDIEVKPLMRLHDNQTRYRFHQFQHLYWVFLYGASYVAWIFLQDFQKYFSRKIAPDASPYTMVRKEHYVFWGTKLVYAIFYLAVPLLMVGWTALIGFAVSAVTCGFVISIVFQLAHVVEDTKFPRPDAATNRIEQEWAIHQVSTTANFATRNKVVCWMLGGLNFQVEHHLFPRVSHVHYPNLNRLVKETCQEFQVNYIEYPSVFQAFRSHLTHLKRLGRA